jgi:hypothetical protein
MQNCKIHVVPLLHLLAWMVVLVTSDTWEEHVERVDKVTRMLKGCN